MKQLVITNRITVRDTESFNLYLKDIYTLTVLTPVEELALAVKASAGDQLAKNELVKRNLRFVVSVAKQYANSTNLLEDLVNEGNIGLIMAAERFEPGKGFRFISYAVWWIQKIICEHLAKHGRLVRLPANKLNGLSKLDKKINILEQKMGRNVDISEVIEEYSAEFDTNEFEYLDVLSTYSVDSLDREIGGDDGSHTTLSDMLSDTTTFRATDHLIIDSDVKSEVARIVNTLKPRDKRIMVALYGLDGQPAMTLKEVGDEIGVTREMIRQIKEKTLATLKNKLKNSSLKEI